MDPTQPSITVAAAGETRVGVFELIFSELSASDAAELEVLMIDATDIKAHPMASSLNKGGAPRLIGGAKGGMTSKLHGVCHSKGVACGST